MSSQTPEALRAFIERCAADMREGARIWRAGHDNDAKALVCEAHAEKFDAIAALLDAQDALRPSREQIEALPPDKPCLMIRSDPHGAENFKQGWDAALDAVLALFPSPPVPPRVEAQQEESCETL